MLAAIEMVNRWRSVLEETPTDRVKQYYYDTVVETWEKFELNAKQLRLSTSAHEAPTTKGSSEVDVCFFPEIRHVSDLLKELFGEAEGFDLGSYLNSAWSSAKALDRPETDAMEQVSHSRRKAGAIPFFVGVILDIISDKGPRERLMEGFYENTINDIHIPDWAFTLSYEVRITFKNVLFILEAKRLQDGRKRNECSYLAEGISQCIKRLVACLKESPSMISALAAVTNCFNIVFVRLDRNQSIADSFDRPFIAARTNVLRLTFQLDAEVREQSDLVNSSKSGSSKKLGNSKSESSKSAELLSRSLVTSSKSEGKDESSKSTAARSPAYVSEETVTGFPPDIPLGFACLMSILCNADEVRDFRRIDGDGLPPLSGIWVKGTWREQLGSGGYAKVRCLEYGGRMYAVKHIGDEEDSHHLIAELEALRVLQAANKSLPGADRVIRLIDELREKDGGSISALILQPVGRAVSELAVADIDIQCFASDIVTALQFAHGLRLCHCDVRPSNIIKYEDRYVLIDLGMSAAIGKTRSHLHGVPAFVHDDILQPPNSPAATYQVRPAHDFASLAYSVLAVLYERSPGCCPWKSVRRGNHTQRRKFLEMTGCSSGANRQPVYPL